MGGVTLGTVVADVKLTGQNSPIKNPCLLQNIAKVNVGIQEAGIQRHRLQ